MILDEMWRALFPKAHEQEKVEITLEFEGEIPVLHDGKTAMCSADSLSLEGNSKATFMVMRKGPVGLCVIMGPEEMVQMANSMLEHVKSLRRG